MRPDLRDRVVLPILLPLGIILFLVALLWGFSRLLLGVTATAATVTATVVALGILVISAVAANRHTIRSSTIGAAFGATVGLAMVTGGIALAVVGSGEAEEPDENGAHGATVELAAANIAFEPTTLSAPADTPFTIEFDNRDSAQHNVEIFDNPERSGTPLFEGEIITGPATVAYRVDPLAEGTYFFLCVVHPQMTGEIEVAPGAPGGEPGGEPGGPGGGTGGGPPGGGAPGDGAPGGAEPATVVAQGIAFDTDTISLPADQPSTLTFDNRDTVPHNIAIYTDDSLSEALFQGEIVTGPATAQYEIPPEPAGEYYFHCDVHPTMNGTVTVG
jgi:plastocyanin